MRDVSAAWLRTVAGSHTPQYRATLVRSFQTTATPTGDRLPIVDGMVTLDGAADVRGSLDLTIPGSYWPVQAGNADLAPQGNEVYIEVGLRYSDDLIEWLGLGYFRVKAIGQDQPEIVGDIRLTGQDRMAGIVRAKLLRPVVFEATDTIGDLVNALVLEVYPDAVIEWDDDTDTRELGRALVVDSDRYGALLSVRQAHGKRMFWNARGALEFSALPDQTKPVARFEAGAGGSLVAAPRELSDVDVYNAVVVRGDGADDNSGAYGVAIDTDLDSPTGYLTRFGPAPLSITSSLVLTDAQAQAAAKAELRLHIGIPYSVSFTSTWRPELEPEDPVRFYHRGMGAPEAHTISSLGIPLRAGVNMTGDTRRQSAVLIGALT